MENLSQKTLQRIFLKKHKIDYSKHTLKYYICSVPAGNLMLPGHNQTWYLRKNGKLYNSVYYRKSKEGWFKSKEMAEAFLITWLKEHTN